MTPIIRLSNVHRNTPPPVVVDGPVAIPTGPTTKGAMVCGKGGILRRE